MSSTQLVVPRWNAELEIELYTSISMLPASIWNIVAGERFYATAEHLAVIENVHSEQMKFYYVLVRRHGEYIGAVYFQHILFSMSNAVNNWKAKNEGKCAVMYPFLYLAKGKQLPLLQSGSVFCTEDNGMYFSEDITEEEKSDILNAVSRYMIKNIPNGKNTYIMYSGFAQESEKNGLEDFHELETEPNLILYLKSTWKTFDDYVANLSSKYRQRVKKVLKSTSDIRIHSLTPVELSEMEGELLHLYRNVAEHASFNMALLSAGYLTSMKHLYGDSFEVKAFRLGDTLVGFSSAFYTKDCQHVHFIGLDYSVNETLPLYHRMLFEFVKDSIHHCHEKLYLGRTATEIKTTIGAEPVEMVNYIKVERAWYKCVLPKVLNRFGAKPYIVRSPFKTLEEVPV